jgi:thioester reductase-like protein
MAGRQAFEHRLALPVASREELAAGLEQFLAGGTDPALTGTVTPGRRSPGESEPDRMYLGLLHARGEVTRLAELWVQGWQIDWEALHGTGHGRIVSLPTYPFARVRHWIDPRDYLRPDQAALPAGGTAPAAVPAAVPAGPRVVPAEPAGRPMSGGNGAHGTNGSNGSNGHANGSNGHANGSNGHHAANGAVANGAVANGAAADAAVADAPAVDPASLRETLESDVRQIFADLSKEPVEGIELTADFSDFGFDSVVTIRMLNQLMKRYGTQIPATTVEEYTTIRSFSAHLIDTGLITGPPSASAPAKGSTRAVMGNHRAQAASEPQIAKITREQPLAADNIFVTGVTGVLGGKLLHDLLTSTSAQVTCLVRGETTEQATERIRYFLGVYDPDDELAGEFARRVTVLLGDVSRERLGVDDATWAKLAEQTDVIIHMAARTTLISFYDALAPTNVEGTSRVIDLALATRQKYLIYISSFSALGDYLYTTNPPFTEHDLELGQGYDHLPYQETKYRAEKLIRAASDRGLVWNIVRPGNIMGEGRTGRYPFAEVSVKGVYYDIFKTAAETGMSMLAPIHWDVSPVDYVSSSIMHLGLRRPSYQETYHLTNPDIRSLFDVSQHISNYGYDLQYLSVDDFAKWADERRFTYRGTDRRYESQTIEMVKWGIEIWGREHYLDSAHPDSHYTYGILQSAGISCAPIADLVPTYLEHCIEVEYLPAPPKRRGRSARRTRSVAAEA